MSEESVIPSLPWVLCQVIDKRPNYQPGIKLCCKIRTLSKTWNNIIGSWCVWRLHDEGRWRGKQPIYQTAMRISPRACLIHLVDCPNCEVKGKQNLPSLLSSRQLPHPSLMLAARFFSGMDASMDKKCRANNITRMLIMINGASEHLLPKVRTRLLSSLITAAASLELPQRATSRAKKYACLFTQLPNKVREHYLARHGLKRVKGTDQSLHPTLVGYIRQHMKRRIRQFFLLCTAVYKDGCQYRLTRATFQPGKGAPGFQAAHDSPLSSLNRINKEGVFQSCALGQGIAPLKIFHQINRTMELPIPANTLDTYVEESAGLREIACHLLNQVANGMWLPPYGACKQFVLECANAIEQARDHYGKRKKGKAANELIIRFANIELVELEKYDGSAGDGNRLRPLLNGLVREWLGEGFDVSNAQAPLQEKLLQPLRHGLV